ncbi:hypothetical protein [Thalassotalea maritima]|uniref:hypothetical protein n=1 Tax=Thalassotalea maritima TaxID=3242416 RepID=UPI0035285F96
MKHYIVAFTLIALLTACDTANKAVDKAQEAATDAVETASDVVESVQEAVESFEFDLDQFNLDQFGSATEQAKAFVLSAQEAVNVDFDDADAVATVKDKIANAYSCLVQASSDMEASELISTLIEKVKNEDAVTLIQQAVEKGASLTECMTQ